MFAMQKVVSIYKKTNLYRTPAGIFLIGSSGQSFKHKSYKTEIYLGSRIIKSSLEIFDQTFTSLHQANLFFL